MEPASKVRGGNFVRGGETTSSVRLRRRKDFADGYYYNQTVDHGGGNDDPRSKKKNRHSGDFLYWPTKSSNDNSGQKNFRKASKTKPQ